MSLKIKVMDRKHAHRVSDEEIRGLMDFNGLVVQAARVTYWAKILGNLKWVTGGLVAVSASVYLWTTPVNSLKPGGDYSSTSQVTVDPPPANATAYDSASVQDVPPVQQLPSMNIQPKKKAVAVREKDVTDASGTPANATPTSSPVTYVVFKEAQPVEGFSHLYKYFGAELKYPEAAIPDSIQGLITVTFVIDTHGKVGKISILNSLGPLFDAEAIRLVNNMPAWHPATIDGKPITTKFSLPLNFQLIKTGKQ